jgi:hypothetical protein
MHQAVVVEHYRKTGQLFPIGKLAVDQQVGGFLEGGFFGQLFHGNTAVSQDTFFPVHISNGAQAASGIGIARIQGDKAGVRAQTLEMSMAFSPSVPGNHRELHLLAVVSEGNEFFHSDSFLSENRRCYFL